MAGRSRRQLVTLVVAGALLGVLVLSAAIVSCVRWSDAKEYVSQEELEVALQTFHPAKENVSLPIQLSVDELVMQTPIATPANCTPLVGIPTSITQIAGAAAWIGPTVGRERYVSLVAVRFNSAAEARQIMMGKRAALVRCHTIQVTHLPLTGPSKRYEVSGHSPISPLMWNRVRYTFCGDEESADFYLRQFANTVIWTSGTPGGSSQARAEVLDSMVDRLKEIKGF